MAPEGEWPVDIERAELRTLGAAFRATGSRTLRLFVLSSGLCSSVLWFLCCALDAWVAHSMVESCNARLHWVFYLLAVFDGISGTSALRFTRAEPDLHGGHVKAHDVHEDSRKLPLSTNGFMALNFGIYFCGMSGMLVVCLCGIVCTVSASDRLCGGSVGLFYGLLILRLFNCGLLSACGIGSFILVERAHLGDDMSKDAGQTAQVAARSEETS
eukprot:CAMPEP_0170652624 /NCGR_PEP_ID=MMETSP0224-20130122/46996_1 /TAXON_ID=285029 /ORGANISM="Togula jolla, Strain CCCM 725" /LENGTH=213 /DNA_ID=CAMNT_0010984487 /DNA_START=38 /DNA_END=675 /DNA_ORIENTATION=-